MPTIPTPHIECQDLNTICKTVIMPGDPLRAEWIANTFLTDVIKFNNVRGMNGYTGTYNNKKISVMGSGMGMPSIGIYSYELYSFYGVENIIRVGSAGSYTSDLKLFDVVLAKNAYSESSFAKVQSGYTLDTIEATKELNDQLKENAKSLNINLVEGTIHSSDVFYRERFEDYIDINKNHNCICVEMESFALFANAKSLGKKAACLLTISDSLVTHEATSSEQRQSSFQEMIKIALEMAE